jgi:hypothetical protein
MDDYSITSLTESKNEWCARLVSLLTHNVVAGINSIFDEAVKLCAENDEDNKYLMTFQNLLSAIPSWNPTTIESERKRIEEESGCKYLEDLVTCVHIIQLKALTCIRVGQKQKKIDIDIPPIDKFVHQIYINTARKLYTNIYLFEKDLYPLQVQKNNRELEILIKEAILVTIRDNVPVERILQCYMEESETVEVANSAPESVDNATSEKAQGNSLPVDLSQNPALIETKLENLASDIDKKVTLESVKPNLVESTAAIVKEESTVLAAPVEEPKAPPPSPTPPLLTKSTIIDFSNKDTVVDKNGKESNVLAPKDLETLERISQENLVKRKEEEAAEDRIEIGEDIALDISPISLEATKLDVVEL